MTRINVVSVETLTNQHLLAEYKEITRPFNKVIKRIENGTMDDVVIPEKYCLGKGHETFFFDKLLWLHLRYLSLFEELLKRGFDIDEDKFYDISSDFSILLEDTKWWNLWQPTPEDIYLNMARLVKRSKIESVLNELIGETL